MAGIQTLGLGSENKLSMDTVNKLKDVEFNATVKPIDKNIEKLSSQKGGLSSLSTLLETLKESTSSLKDELVYQERTAYISSDSIDVKLDKGVLPQSFSLEVEELAQENVINSNVFASRTEHITNGNEGTLKISIGDQSSTLTVKSDATLEDLMQQINDSSLPVSAKILNTGNSQYKLILSGENSGAENNISIEETNLITNLNDEVNIVQKATDSKISFNGIGISRSSNKITDLIYGVTINLSEETTSPVKVTIAEDSNSLISYVQSFVDGYNEFVKNFDELTKYDDATKESGIFQGNNDIRAVKREINKVILQLDKNNNSLVEFGITLNSSGKLEFNTADFTKKFEEDPSAVQTFFQGIESESKGRSVHIGGVFYNLDKSLESFVGSSGLLTNLKTGFDKQETRLNKEREKAVELLDRRYNRLAEQFAQQDTIINQITQQFSSLQMQIDYATAKN